MKIHLTFILMIVALTANAQDLSLYQAKIFISQKGDTLPYRILFPENYDRSKEYPLILFLHGAGERGRDNQKQLVHGSKLFLDSLNRKNFPAIVIFPQCPAGNYWASVLIDRSQAPLSLTFDYNYPPTSALTSATELVQKIIREESVAEKQVYAIGLSMGGMGTFEILYRNPKMFAAAVPICGGGDTRKYDKKVKKIPFWIFHGAKDAVVDVRHSREMVSRLKILKADVNYTEYPDVNHNSWDYAFAEPELLKWLFSHKR